MKSENTAAEAKGADYEVESGLEKQESVIAGDTMLTQGRGGQTERGLKSRHIQFL